MAVALGNQCREEDIHRPSPVLAALGAEFPAGHEDRVGRLWQPTESIPIQQIGANRFDAGFRTPASSMARFARTARLGPIFPPTPRMRRSPSNSLSASQSLPVGRVRISSNCSVVVIMIA